MISSRTPEGEPNYCAVCHKRVAMEPSQPLGDAPCPHCGCLLRFERTEDRVALAPGTGEQLIDRAVGEALSELSANWRDSTTTENGPREAKRQGRKSSHGHAGKTRDCRERQRNGPFREIFGKVFAFWFGRHFKRLQFGMCPNDVRRLLGDPTDVEQSTIPSDSGIRLQQGSHSQLPPRSPYLQWRYLKGSKAFLLFFARVDSGELKLTFFVSYPSVVEEMIASCCGASAGRTLAMESGLAA